jgi:hypothetical protein
MNKVFFYANLGFAVINACLIIGGIATTMTLIALPLNILACAMLRHDA